MNCFSRQIRRVFPVSGGATKWNVLPSQYETEVWLRPCLPPDATSAPLLSITLVLQAAPRDISVTMFIFWPPYMTLNTDAYLAAVY